MHDDNAVTDDKAKKPELINFCNQTKGEFIVWICLSTATCPNDRRDNANVFLL